MTNRDAARCVHFVVTDPIAVGIDLRSGGHCLLTGVERFERGASIKGPMRPGAVVVLDEEVELTLQLLL